MPWTEASGISLHYEVSSQGQPLLLIHELGGSLLSWDPILPHLPGFRILRYDQRGAGLSEKPRQPYALAEQLSDLESVIADSKIETPLSICAVAAGAPIALAFAATRPQQVAKVIVCSPAIGVSSARLEYLTQRCQLAAEQGIKAILGMSIDQSFPANQADDLKIHREYRAQFLAYDPVAYGLANMALANAHAGSLIEKIQTPVSVFGGTRDKLRPIEEVRKLATQIPNAQYESLEAGHFMHVERPALVAQRIAAHLKHKTLIGDQIVSVNGVELNCRIQGRVSDADAAWIVFANSLATDLSVWQQVAEPLGNRFRILRYDQRGHGKSSVPTTPITFDDLASDALGLMDHFAIRQATFVGVSMGAITGLLLAEKHPDRLKALIACDGQPYAPPTNATMWPPRIEQARTKGMESLVEPTIERWFPQAFRQSGSPNLDRVRAMIRSTPAHGYIANASALLDYDLRPNASSISTPTLLIAGAEDGILPQSLRELQTLIPGSRYADIPDCGHLPPIQNPEFVVQEIISHLASIGLL